MVQSVKKGSLMKTTLVYVLILVCALTMCSCGNPTNEIEKAIDNSDYAKVAEIYREKIQGNIEKENEVQLALLDKLGNAITNYNLGNQSYEEAHNLISTIDKSGILEYSGIDDVYHMLSFLKESKEAFKFGEDHMITGEYADAANYFQMVVVEDALHEKALENLELCVSNLKNNLSQIVDNLIADKNYTSALNEIDVVSQNLMFYIDFSEIENNVYNQWYASVKDESDSFVEDKDYPSAMQVIDDAIAYFPSENSNLESLNALREATLGKYVNYVTSKADEVFANGNDYEGAIKVLQDAGSYLSEVDEILEKIDWYRSFAPMLLTSLTPIKDSQYISEYVYDPFAEYRFDEYDKDVNNTVYSEGAVIAPCGGTLASQVSQSEEESSICYYLNSEYSKFWGVLYRPYESLHSGYTWNEPTTVKIYGDGKLLYEAPNFTQSTFDPVNFSVDVTGVRELKIVMMGVWDDDTSMSLYLRHPKVCAANLYIQK